MPTKALSKSAYLQIIAQDTDTGRETAAFFLDVITGTVLREVKKAGEFTFPGIGKLVKKRKARMGCNPKTGQSIKIPAKTVVKFKASKSVKGCGIGDQMRMLLPTHKGMRRYFQIAAALSLGLQPMVFGEDATTEEAKKTLMADARAWAGFDLFRCSLNLKSDRQVRWYLFHSDNLVSVTLGMKNEAIASPLWYWRISGKWLQILNSDGKLLFQMRPLKVSATEFSVDNGRGETELYEIQH